jgi:hypothetical protein
MVVKPNEPIKFRVTNEIKLYKYSETSQNRPALGPKIMAGLEGWPVFNFYETSLERIILQGLKKSADIQGELVL